MVLLRIVRLCVLALLFARTSAAQIPKHLFNAVSGEDFSTKDFKPSPASMQKKLGVYHFGESEGEWDLVLVPYGDSIIVQAWTGQWGKNRYTRQDDWQLNCKTYNDGFIKGNKLAFGKFNGFFVEYQDVKKSGALLLFGNIAGGTTYKSDSADVGFYSESTRSFFSSYDYPQLSTSVLVDNDFKGKSKQELKIMRNSIYAKYGLIFQSAGDMEKYFRSKNWYHPHRQDVSSCLTSIEKKNIQTIQKLEQELP